MVNRGTTDDYYPVYHTDDAATLLKLSLQLDTESTFMMLEPGERTTTIAEQSARLAGILKGGGTVIVAEHDGTLVGYLGVFRGKYRRNQHSAELVVGVLQAYAGQGIGTRLFETLETWAMANGIHRLELTVQAHIAAAVGLYKKVSFTIEGTRHHSMHIDGTFVDEYTMAKLLNQS